MNSEGHIQVRILDAGGTVEASLWARKGIEAGAEGAEEENSSVKLYFSDGHQEAMEGFLSLLEQEGLSFEKEKLPEQDWNREWEESFRPVFIQNNVVVRAPFHHKHEDFPYRIEVRPERAFGTGHHPTTYLMLEKILDLPLQGKTVLDMGCGTGILAIFCEMRGADRILAIDNDRWAVRNAERTVEENGCEGIKVEYGNRVPWRGRGFDVILGNIQREPLISLIPDAAHALNFEGYLIMSGLRREDITRIREKCDEEKLFYLEEKELDGWVMLAYQKRSGGE